MCVCSVCTAFVSYIIKKTIEYNIEQFVWFIDAFGFSYAKLRRITLQITYNVLMLCDAWWKFMMRFLISQMNLLALELFRERATSNKFQQHISLSVRIVWMCECLCELRIRLVSLVLRLVLVFFCFCFLFLSVFLQITPIHTQWAVNYRNNRSMQLIYETILSFSVRILLTYNVEIQV